MNLALKLGILFSSVALAFLEPPAAHAQTVIVRGRVDRKLEKPRNPPVPYMRVTLTPKDGGAVPRAEYTDTDGMYYFQNTKPGRYVIELWGGPKEDKLIFKEEYQVQQKKPGDRYSDIKPILIK